MIKKIRGVLPKSTDKIGDILDRNKGVGPGFDLLRVALAVIIFTIHTGSLSRHGHDIDIMTPVNAANIAHTAVHHVTAWDGWGRPALVALLPMFFALSGFLVSGSAFRLRRVSTFLSFRVLRILPALLTEVTLSALVLGPIFTTLPLKSYFTDPGFWRYFGNVVGMITFVLPGVFHQLVQPMVNGNLWTLPGEFDCYLLTAVLMAVGLFYNRVFFTIAFAVATVILAPLNMFTSFDVRPMMVSEYALVFYFMAGVLVFHWRDRISASPWLFVVAAVAALGLLESKHTVYLAPLFVTYCTVWFGMVALPRLPIIKHGDYSYGIYLYGFPITQAVMATFPGFAGHRWQLWAVAGLATCGFAAASWHFIEKPSLRFKNRLPAWIFPPQAHIPATQEPAPASA